jgi:hypothetical protein
MPQDAAVVLAAPMEATKAIGDQDIPTSSHQLHPGGSAEEGHGSDVSAPGIQGTDLD